MSSPLQTVTYSPSYTLVPTYECFNRCAYCNFRVDPGRDEWMELEQAATILRSLQTHQVIEILVLSGEVHPQNPQRSDWFRRIYDLCALALHLGFLPHTNAGPLSWDEMKLLKEVNVSMGLMLEQMTPALVDTVHRHAPSKVPSLRLQQLEWAGASGIPFTTGLLLGIGETEADWGETLDAIAEIHQRYGHIQEVILQPHSPGQRQSWEGMPFPPERLVDAVAIARQRLPADITLQIPPNLIPTSDLLLACLTAGARDLGGINPRDEVNPDYLHEPVYHLAATLQKSNWHLVPRLPVYPQYDSWLSPRLQERVRYWRDRVQVNHALEGCHSYPFR